MVFSASAWAGCTGNTVDWSCFDAIGESNGYYYGCLNRKYYVRKNSSTGPLTHAIDDYNMCGHAPRCSSSEKPALCLSKVEIDYVAGWDRGCDKNTAYFRNRNKREEWFSKKYSDAEAYCGKKPESKPQLREDEPESNERTEVPACSKDWNDGNCYDIRNLSHSGYDYACYQLDNKWYRRKAGSNNGTWTRWQNKSCHQPLPGQDEKVYYCDQNFNSGNCLNIKVRNYQGYDYACHENKDRWYTRPTGSSNTWHESTSSNSCRDYN